jgi:hypothetical protein
VADPGVRQELEHRFDHAQTGSKHRHDDHVPVEPIAFGWLEGRLHCDADAGETTRGVDCDDLADPAGQPTEMTWRGGLVA